MSGSGPSPSSKSGERSSGFSRMASLFKAAAAPRAPSRPERPFDPEADIDQKRQWAARQAHAGPAGGSYSQPSARLFEHFAVVGLPPELNVKAVSADIRTYHTARQAGGAGMDSITPDPPPAAAAAPRRRQHGLRGPALPAEVLFSFPGPLPPDLAATLAAFCHPHGVRPELLERTPSLSALHEVIYAQPHQAQDDLSFVFLMRVSDGTAAAPRALYGVCCYMRELVHRPPALAGAPPPPAAPLARYTVAAPRCYCLLTHYPFFDLHFRVLDTVLGLERLARMTAFPEELAAAAAGGAGAALPSPLAPSSRVSTADADSPGPCASYTQTEVTSSSASSAAEGEEDEEDGGEAQGGGAFLGGGFATPAGATEGAEGDAGAEPGGAAGGRRVAAALAGLQLEAPPGGSDGDDGEDAEEEDGGAAVPAESEDSGQYATPAAALLPPAPFSSPAAGSTAGGGVAGRRAARHHASAAAAGPASPGAAPAGAGAGAGRRGSSEVSEAETVYASAVQSSAPSASRLTLGAAGAGASPGSSAGDLAGLPATLQQLLDTRDAATGATQPGQQSEEQAQRPLQAAGAAAAAPAAPRPGGANGEDGSDAAAPPAPPALDLDLSRPLEALDLLRAFHQAAVPLPGHLLTFQPDPGLQAIAFRRPDPAAALAGLGLRPSAAALPDLDAAHALGGWAVAALCRSLSLDNVLAFLAAALLERQVVVFCPHVGLLSGVVLSLVPLLLPFSWQCLLLPVLPATPARLDLLEAPVPFVAGVVYKTAEVAAKCGGLVRVNVYKDRVRAPAALPALPRGGELAEALAGAHAALRRAGRGRGAAARPAHAVVEGEAAAAAAFLGAVRSYLRGLVADLKGYTITEVTGAGGGGRVSVLLRDSFLDSFPPRDRPFMRQFTDTQMFAVYCDSVL